MKTLALFLYVLFAAAALQAQNITISGSVYDAGSGEAIIGALIFSKEHKQGTATNEYGFYSLTIPAGPSTIICSYVSYVQYEKTLELKQNLDLNIKLEPNNTVQAVVITANSNKEQIKSTQMSTIRVPVEQVKNMPSLGGEVDIIKVMQLMPGVKRGGEGQTGMYVRGGGADQNLIVLDEAVVYNVSHLFGFFSVFNNDALKDVTLIKGGFPAQYGGRISSILDIRMKEGNTQKYSAEGGVGMLSSRLTLQGPLVKDKMSFLVSGRRSYIDKVFGAVGLPIPYYFYDINGKLNYKISEKDRIYYSTYIGDDVLSEPKMNGDDGNSGFDTDFGFKLGNHTNSLRWNRRISPKMFSNLSLIQTRFKYDINGKFMDNSIFIGSKINDIGAKLDYDYYPNTLNHIRFGGMITNHTFRPNIISAQGEISELIKSKKVTPVNTQEVGIYFTNERHITEKLTINYGFRLSGLLTQGKTYIGPEPRFSATYAFSNRSSIKASYSRMYQYMHLVSSSSVALPTDLWYPVTKQIKPQFSDQVAAGYNFYMEKLQSIVTVEAYYKRMHNLIEYREGAVLVLNDKYEDELLRGKGDAYGLEFFINKNKGRFNGWIGYSLSWATRQFDGLNEGKSFYAKYDRRHDISVVGNYDISKRVSFSAVWVYGTGQRLTARMGQFIMPNPANTHLEILPIYSGKNEFKFSPSHRLDLNLVIKRKPTRTWSGDWHLGGYNIYNRAQPYRVTIEHVEGKGFVYRQRGLFGFVPSISYNFKF